MAPSEHGNQNRKGSFQTETVYHQENMQFLYL